MGICERGKNCDSDKSREIHPGNTVSILKLRDVDSSLCEPETLWASVAKYVETESLQRHHWH